MVPFLSFLSNVTHAGFETWKEGIQFKLRVPINCYCVTFDV